ncbi:amino acid adenylation domain-containing protein [Micromonospora sp. NPDC050980]|uniref:non-ribosomal peptide synthetase n=1 Tax=Micromonospora sp. NPDC050980 TaxID=3155161 RepID=UPI0033D17B2D
MNDRETSRGDGVSHPSPEDEQFDRFWRQRLDGHNPCLLPRWSAGREGEPDIGRIDLPLPATLVAGMRGAARSGDTRLHRTVLAAFMTVVGRLVGDDDVTIGLVTVSGVRPLRLDLAGRSWVDLLRAIDRTVRELDACSDRPLSRIRAAVATEPLFDTAFADGPHELSEVALAVTYDESRTDRVTLRYRAAALDADQAHRIGSYLRRALELMAAAPTDPHARGDQLSAAERHFQLTAFAGRERRLPPRRFHELFAERARRSPDAVGVTLAGGESWTYGELHRASERVARGLLAAGVAAEEVVAVATARNPSWLAAFIGILRAGAVYLPVDTGHPPARIRSVLAQSGARIVLTGPGGLDEVPDGVRLLRLDELIATYRPDYPSAPDVAAGQLAYVLFTSGSTGLPKGAMCEHAGMVNHLLAKVEDLGLRERDVVVQSANQCFDVSIWQLFAPLLVGGRTLLVDDATVREPHRFVDTIVACGATVFRTVPSYLDVLLGHLEQRRPDLGRLRRIAVVGEALPRSLTTRWFALYPDIPIINTYGPTEACDGVSHEILTVPPEAELVPVGRPVPNVNMYVLGADGDLLPLGCIGEIAYSGVCVGRGYINDPRRTAEAFRADPFDEGRRMYLSGDFGRWLPSGKLEFHGRRDDQVKIRGVRVELGEVQNHILRHPQVTGGCALALPDRGQGQRLVAFYMTADDLTPAGLTAFLAGLLPPNALPARLLRVEDLPLTANGKTDRKTLLRWAEEAEDAIDAGAVSPEAAPDTATERLISRAWAAALDRPVSAVRRTDHFFDSGGTSLSALRMIADLDGLVTLADLIRKPVLHDLAAVVDGLVAPAAGRLIRIAGDPARATRALVLLPDAAVPIADLNPVVSQLVRQDPALAAYAPVAPHQERGPGDDACPDLTRLAAQLAGEVAALRLPVSLYGQGTGTALAFETARRLVEAGTEPGQLVLSGRPPGSDQALRREIDQVEAANDQALGAVWAARRGSGDTTGIDLSVVGRAYRRDVVGAARYFLQAGRIWSGRRLTCPVTAVVVPGGGGDHRRWSSLCHRYVVVPAPPDDGNQAGLVSLAILHAATMSGRPAVGGADRAEQTSPSISERR